MVSHTPNVPLQMLKITATDSFGHRLALRRLLPSPARAPVVVTVTVAASTLVAATGTDARPFASASVLKHPAAAHRAAQRVARQAAAQRVSRQFTSWPSWSR